MDMRKIYQLIEDARWEESQLRDTVAGIEPENEQEAELKQELMGYVDSLSSCLEQAREQIEKLLGI